MENYEYLKLSLTDEEANQVLVDLAAFGYEKVASSPTFVTKEGYDKTDWRNIDPIITGGPRIRKYTVKYNTLSFRRDTNQPQYASLKAFSEDYLKNLSSYFKKNERKYHLKNTGYAFGLASGIIFFFAFIFIVTGAILAIIDSFEDYSMAALKILYIIFYGIGGAFALTAALLLGIGIPNTSGRKKQTQVTVLMQQEKSNMNELVKQAQTIKRDNDLRMLTPENKAAHYKKMLADGIITEAEYEKLIK